MKTSAKKLFVLGLLVGIVAATIIGSAQIMEAKKLEIGVSIPIFGASF